MDQLGADSFLPVMTPNRADGESVLWVTNRDGISAKLSTDILFSSPTEIEPSPLTLLSSSPTSALVNTPITLSITGLSFDDRLTASLHLQMDDAQDNIIELAVEVTDPNYATLSLPEGCLLYTSPSPRDQRGSRMPSSA